MGTDGDNPTATLYGNFKCPYTQKFVREGNLEAVLNEYVESGDLNLRFRALAYQPPGTSSHGGDYYYISDSDPLISEAAMGVWDVSPGDYWGFFDYMFSDLISGNVSFGEMEGRMESASVSNRGTIIDRADSGRYADQVKRNRYPADEYGVTYTPTLVLDGETIAPHHDTQTLLNWIGNRISTSGDSGSNGGSSGGSGSNDGSSDDSGNNGGSSDDSSSDGGSSNDSDSNGGSSGDSGSNSGSSDGSSSGENADRSDGSSGSSGDQSGQSDDSSSDQSASSEDTGNQSTKDGSTQSTNSAKSAADASHSGGSSDDKRTRTITIDGRPVDGMAWYRIETTDNVEKSRAMAASISGEDTVSGSIAEGIVGPWKDSYTITGELTEFSITTKTKVWIDGERVDPANLG